MNLANCCKVGKIAFNSAAATLLACWMGSGWGSGGGG